MLFETVVDPENRKYPIRPKQINFTLDPGKFSEYFCEKHGCVSSQQAHLVAYMSFLRGNWHPFTKDDIDFYAKRFKQCPYGYELSTNVDSLTTERRPFFYFDGDRYWFTHNFVCELLLATAESKMHSVDETKEWFYKIRPKHINHMYILNPCYKGFRFNDQGLTSGVALLMQIFRRKNKWTEITQKELDYQADEMYGRSNYNPERLIENHLLRSKRPGVYIINQRFIIRAFQIGCDDNLLLKVIVH